MTMPALAEMLAPFVDRPVIDGTRLKGTYQVTLDLPFDAMMRVIQNLGGTAAVQGGFAVFPGGGLAADSVGLQAVLEARWAPGALGPRRTRQLRQSFSRSNNSA